MLVELSVMEQRYQAVLAVIQDGWKVTEVADALGGLTPERAHLDRTLRARRLGRARRSFPPSEHVPTPDRSGARGPDLRDAPRASWAGGLAGSNTSSRASAWIRCPSRSAIYRCLKRHGLIELRRRRKRRDEFRRWQRERPMQLWQMDVMGGVLLDDGSELQDRHRAWMITAGSASLRVWSGGRPPRPSARSWPQALSRHGIPDEILTDNGKVFTGRFGPQPVEVLFDRICRENGIAHRHTAPRSPTTTGKIERFHQTVRREFLADRTLRLDRTSPARTRCLGR